VDPDAAAAAGRSLDRRDAAARVALRVDRTRERLRGNPPCPGCGERLLRVESACPPAARVVVCTAGCQCTGQQTCPCGMPVRTEWAPHVWLESDLDHVLQYNRVDRWVRSAAAMAARVGNGQRTAEEAAACSTSPG
jgi:hypothetical protein